MTNVYQKLSKVNSTMERNDLPKESSRERTGKKMPLRREAFPVHDYFFFKSSSIIWLFSSCSLSDRFTSIMFGFRSLVYSGHRVSICLLA